MDLPGVSRAADIDANIGSAQLELLVPGRYRLLLALPHVVDDAVSKARFHKDSQQVQLTLTVVPPAAPQPLLKAISTRAVAAVSGSDGTAGEGSSAAAAGSDEADTREASTAEDVAALQEEATPSGTDDTPAAARAPCSSEAVVPAAPGSSAAGPQLTENQRKWLELHNQGG